MLQNCKTDVSAIYHLTGQAKLGSGLSDPGPTSWNYFVKNYRGITLAMLAGIQVSQFKYNFRECHDLHLQLR